MDLLTVIIPTLPGFFWLFVFYKTDKYQPEPKGLVIQTFVLGIASIVPVLMMSDMIKAGYDYVSVTTAAMRQQHYDETRLIVACGIIGLTEELSKYWAVRVWAYRRPAFDEPPDGVVYAAAAALGFAAIENISYVAASGKINEQLLLMRSILSLPAHVMFALVWGAALSYARFRPGLRGFVAQLFGVLGAAALHGTFDYFAFTQRLNFALVPLMICMTYMTWVIVRTLRRASQFAPGKPLHGYGHLPSVPSLVPAPVPVPVPGSPPLYGAGYASYPSWLPGGYAPPTTAPWCTRCGARGVAHDDKFCGHCGTSFQRSAAA